MSESPAHSSLAPHFRVYARCVKAIPFCSALSSIFAALALSACGGDDSSLNPPKTEPPIEAPKLTSRRLVTRGTAFLDSLGRKVILRGVNVGGRSKMPPFVPFESASDSEIPERAAAIMSAVQRLGANGVRLVMSWEGLEPERGSYD
ncbi:MAG: fimbrillin family protein, partial [Polyangiaceae bacterium]